MHEGGKGCWAGWLRSFWVDCARTRHGAQNRLVTNNQQAAYHPHLPSLCNLACSVSSCIVSRHSTHSISTLYTLSVSHTLSSIYSFILISTLSISSLFITSCPPLYPLVSVPFVAAVASIRRPQPQLSPATSPGLWLIPVPFGSSPRLLPPPFAPFRIASSPRPLSLSLFSLFRALQVSHLSSRHFPLSPLSSPHHSPPGVLSLESCILRLALSPSRPHQLVPSLPP